MLSQRFAIALTATVMGLSLAYADEKKPPNIVFMFSDDHAYQAISAYNDKRKLIETPNIDRIAKEGMRFDRCIVPNSICGPSRATVLTGKYSHMNGFYDNSGDVFDGSQMTFAKLLQKNGYSTAMIGKWHLGSDPTGFDYWNILPGQGDYYNPVMIKNGERSKHTGYVSDLITNDAMDWLKTGRDKSKPFLLMYQQKAPHRQWDPALRHLGHDNDRQYPIPETLFDDYRGRGIAEETQDMSIAKTMTPGDLKLNPPRTLNPEQLKEWNAYYEPRNKAFLEANLKGEELIRWKYNRYMHDYLGCIKAVDEGVGELLDYLDKEGLAENTIVVYTADQGFYLGEHGWFDKRWIFEESLRTPLVVRWPGVVKPGTVDKHLVSNLDFAPTFLEAAGVEISASIQGKSMIPILKGEDPQDWRKSFYYQYYEHPGPHNVRRHYGVVTDRYKLVRFYEGDDAYWELFDLQKDPREMTSVYGQTDYAEVQATLKKELDRLRTELKVPDADPAQSLPGNGRKQPMPKKN